MKPANLQPGTRLTVDADFDSMPLAGEAAVEAFGEWLDAELEQLLDRWSAWSTVSSTRSALNR